MGSGDWIKSIIKLKKVKNHSSNRSSSSCCKNHSEKQSPALANDTGDGMPNPLATPSEDKAAIRIQTAFRAYVARKALRHLKGMVGMRKLTKKFPVKRQATTTLGNLHSWSKIQSQVGARCLCMVTEGRIREKKLGNQMKFEDKLEDDLSRLSLSIFDFDVLNSGCWNWFIDVAASNRWKKFSQGYARRRKRLSSTSEPWLTHSFLPKQFIILHAKAKKLF